MAHLTQGSGGGGHAQQKFDQVGISQRCKTFRPNQPEHINHILSCHSHTPRLRQSTGYTMTCFWLYSGMSFNFRSNNLRGMTGYQNGFWLWEFISCQTVRLLNNFPLITLLSILLLSQYNEHLVNLTLVRNNNITTWFIISSQYGDPSSKTGPGGRLLTVSSEKSRCDTFLHEKQRHSLPPQIG